MQSITEILLSIPQPDLRYCFQMGYECEMNGANTTNCHFSIFSTKERMQAWEAGKKKAAQVKESAQQNMHLTAGTHQQNGGSKRKTATAKKAGSPSRK